MNNTGFRPNQRNDDFEVRFNTRMDEFESRLSNDIRKNTKWMIGMMIPVWIGILIMALA